MTLDRGDRPERTAGSQAHARRLARLSATPPTTAPPSRRARPPAPGRAGGPRAPAAPRSRRASSPPGPRAASRDRAAGGGRGGAGRRPARGPGAAAGRRDCRGGGTTLASSITGAQSASSPVWRMSATTCACPTSRQIATAGELMRRRSPRSMIGVAERVSGPGNSGARFSSAIVTPIRSATVASAASERASAASTAPRSGPLAERQRVVDDLARADLGRVGEQALEGDVRGLGADAKVRRRVHHRGERGGGERLAGGHRVLRALPRTREHRDRGRVELHPAEAGGLVGLQQRRGRPPLVRDAEPESPRRQLACPALGVVRLASLRRPADRHLRADSTLAARGS